MSTTKDEVVISDNLAEAMASTEPDRKNLRPAKVPRSCGSCSLCCILFSIDDIPKANNVTCPHCTLGRVGSCNIYEDRPDPCINFRCLWLQAGDFDGGQWIKYYKKEFRPDKIGALMDINPTGEILLVRVKKYREFAGLKKAFRIMVIGMAQTIPLLVVDGDGSYKAVGKAMFDWFEKQGYETKAVKDGSGDADKWDEMIVGKKGLYEHLANSKVKKVKTTLK